MPAGRIALGGKPRDWYRFRTVEYGVMMFVMAVFIGWLAVSAASRDMSVTAILMAVAIGCIVVGIGLLAWAVRESRPHSIVLDDDCIQFMIGGSVKWMARFSDIRAIGTPDKTWLNPRDTVFGDKIAANSGFWLRTDAGMHSVNVFQHIQNVDTLMDAFNILNSRLSPTVERADESNWIRTGRGAVGEISVDTGSIIDGEWYPSSRPYYILKILGGLGLFLLVLSLIALYDSSTNGRETSRSLWYIIISVSMIIAGFGAETGIPNALRMSRDGLSLKYFLVGVREYTWAEMERCAPGQHADSIIITMTGSGRRISGYFKRDVVMVAVQRHKVSLTYPKVTNAPYPREADEARIIGK